MRCRQHCPNRLKNLGVPWLNASHRCPNAPRRYRPEKDTPDPYISQATIRFGKTQELRGDPDQAPARERIAQAKGRAEEQERLRLEDARRRTAPRPDNEVRGL